MSTLAQRLQFYVASEFGIDDLELVDMDSKTLISVVRKCSRKAYQDLKRTIPYAYSTEKLKRSEEDERDSFSALKASFIEKVEEIIIDELISDDKLKCENLNPQELIKKVIKISSEDRFAGLFKPEMRFTVGLAQKWINMTIKYLWILGVFDDDYEELIEVPIDRFIISKLESLGIIISCNWSTWNNIKEYAKVQEKLRAILRDKGQTRIAWENESWTDIRATR